MRDINFSKSSFIIIFSAILCILYVLLFQENAVYRPVKFGDSDMYVSTAKAMFDYAKSPHVTEPYVQMKKKIPLVDALASRGPGYPLFLSLFAGFENVESVVRKAQLALYIIGGFLLVSIIRMKAWGESATGAIMYFCYIPLATYTSFLLTESLTSFLLLLFLFFHVKAQETRRFNRYAFVIGASLAALMLVRPAFQYFSMLSILLLTLYYFKVADSTRRSTILLLLIGFFTLYGPWLVIINGYQNINNEIFWQVTAERSIARSQIESYDLSNSGYPRPYGGVGTSSSMYESVFNAPLESFGLRTEKYIRLIQNPATLYNNQYLIPETVLKGYHLFIVSTAIISLFFFLRAPVNFIIASSFIYTCIIYTGYFSEERRFLLPVMPIAIILTTYVINLFVQNLSFSPNKTIYRSLMVFIVMAIGFTFLFGFDGIDLGNRYLHLGFHVLGGIILLFACYMISLVLNVNDDFISRVYFIAYSIAFICIPLTIHSHLYHPWQRWSTHINKNNFVRQKIMLPHDIDICNILHATMQIDMQYESRFKKSIVVTINGNNVEPLMSPQSRPRSLIKRGMRPYFGKLDDNQLYPQDWELLHIPKDLLMNKNLNITIKTSKKDGEAYAVLYGSLQNDRDAPGYYGPRPYLDPLMQEKVIKSFNRESIWKYQTTNDVRLYDFVPLRGNTNSDYITYGNSNEFKVLSDDLSLSPFSQTGSYNIRIQLIMKDGREILI